MPRSKRLNQARIRTESSLYVLLRGRLSVKFLCYGEMISPVWVKATSPEIVSSAKI